MLHVNLTFFIYFIADKVSDWDRHPYMSILMNSTDSAKLNKSCNICILTGLCCWHIWNKTISGILRSLSKALKKWCQAEMDILSLCCCSTMCIFSDFIKSRRRWATWVYITHQNPPGAVTIKDKILWNEYSYVFVKLKCYLALKRHANTEVKQFADTLTWVAHVDVTGKKSKKMEVFVFPHVPMQRCKLRTSCN